MELEVQNIPTIREDKQYWFIRTYGGETFRDYYKNNYIGIGVNNIPQSLIKAADYKKPESVTILYNFIEKNTSYKFGAATKLTRELISFEHEIKPGDTIVIPSRNSYELAIGTVQSEVYLVKETGTFTFRKHIERYPEKRRKIKWEKIVYRDDLNGDLRGLTASHHGLTNANAYADIIEGTVDSLYIKNQHIYFTLKINQDEDINAFVLSRFLNGLTYFYQEFSRDNGFEADEDLILKIKLQSKGTVAMKAATLVGIVGIAGMIALSDNNDVKVDLKNMKVSGKSDGFLKSFNNFLNGNLDRKIRYEEFQDSMKQLKAKRLDKSLKSEEEVSNTMKTKGEQKDGK